MLISIIASLVPMALGMGSAPLRSPSGDTCNSAAPSPVVTVASAPSCPSDAGTTWQFGAGVLWTATDGRHLWAIRRQVIDAYDISDITSPRLVGRTAPLRDILLNIQYGAGLVLAEGVEYIHIFTLDATGALHQTGRIARSEWRQLSDLLDVVGATDRWVYGSVQDELLAFERSDLDMCASAVPQRFEVGPQRHVIGPDLRLARLGPGCTAPHQDEDERCVVTYLTGDPPFDAEREVDLGPTDVWALYPGYVVVHPRSAADESAVIDVSGEPREVARFDAEMGVAAGKLWVWRGPPYSTDVYSLGTPEVTWLRRFDGHRYFQQGATPDHVLANGGGGSYVVSSVDDSGNLTEIGRLQGNSMMAHDVEWMGNTLLGASKERLWLFDAHGSSPVFRSSHELPAGLVGSGWVLDADRSLIWSLDTSSHVLAFEVPHGSAPPRVVQSHPAPPGAYWMRGLGEVLMIAAADQPTASVSVIDVSEPDSPVLLHDGALPSGNYPERTMALSRELAAYGDPDGVVLLNLRDPASTPVRVKLGRRPKVVAVSGTTVWAADDTHITEIAASDPASPIVVADIPWPDGVGGPLYAMSSRMRDLVAIFETQTYSYRTVWLEFRGPASPRVVTSEFNGAIAPDIAIRPGAVAFAGWGEITIMTEERHPDMYLPHLPN